MLADVGCKGLELRTRGHHHDDNDTDDEMTIMTIVVVITILRADPQPVGASLTMAHASYRCQDSWRFFPGCRTMLEAFRDHVEAIHQHQATAALSELRVCGCISG